MKKVLLILVAVVLGPILVVGLLRAAGDWRAIGQTDGGDKVYVSSMRVKGTQRVGLVRVEYKEPTTLPIGGPFVEMRARVRVNCSNGQVVPSSEWFYTRDRSGRVVVSKKSSRDDQFGKSSEGGFAELVRKNVCGEK